MSRILKIIDAICDAGGYLAAFSAALLAVMLIVEVGVTSFASWSQPWAVEYSGYLLAVILFAGSGWTLRQGGHIRVSAMTSLFPGNVRRWLDLAATAFAIGLVAYVALAATQYALRSFELGSTSYYPSRTPQFYPQSILAASFWILFLAFIARFLRLCSGREPATGGGFTVPSVDEEA